MQLSSASWYCMCSLFLFPQKIFKCCWSHVMQGSHDICTSNNSAHSLSTISQELIYGREKKLNMCIHGKKILKYSQVVAGAALQLNPAPVLFTPVTPPLSQASPAVTSAHLVNGDCWLKLTCKHEQSVSTAPAFRSSDERSISNLLITENTASLADITHSSVFPCLHVPPCVCSLKYIKQITNRATSFSPNGSYTAPWAICIIFIMHNFTLKTLDES